MKFLCLPLLAGMLAGVVSSGAHAVTLIIDEDGLPPPAEILTPAPPALAVAAPPAPAKSKAGHHKKAPPPSKGKLKSVQQKSLPPVAEDADADDDE